MAAPPWPTLRARAIADASSARQNKEAIEAIFESADPEILMILGAPDVVPNQDVSNPMFELPDDPDRYAFGDLVYACDTPYCRDAAAFGEPTRVVGRLPDLYGAREASYLLALLDVAAKHRTRDLGDYSSCFDLSTYSWRKFTALSLFNFFGNSDAWTLAPPHGPMHPARRLAPLAHPINCHGGEADPAFYGEMGRAQPKSLTSIAIKGRIGPGSVAAAECSFGAELYDSVTLALPLPIGQQYLLRGAYGYFGASTIAYGPPVRKGAADLITQYFLLAIVEGASLGAVWLRSAGEYFLLRCKEGPSYGDTALRAYTGKRVRCDDFVVGHLLLAERIKVMP